MKPNTLANFIKKFENSESGATAIEYGLITTGIAVVIMVAVTLVGNSLSSFFGGLSGNF